MVSITRICPRLGTRFSKVLKAFLARKAIRIKNPTRSFYKASLLICCKGNKIEITAMCGVSERLCSEVVKGIKSREKFRDFRETGPCPATQIRPELILFCKIETRRPNRNREQYPTRMKKFKTQNQSFARWRYFTTKTRMFFQNDFFFNSLGNEETIRKINGYVINVGRVALMLE